jgi:hypothetical protein
LFCGYVARLKLFALRLIEYFALVTAKESLVICTQQGVQGDGSVYLQSPVPDDADSNTTADRGDQRRTFLSVLNIFADIELFV